MKDHNNYRKIFELVEPVESDDDFINGIVRKAEVTTMKRSARNIYALSAALVAVVVLGAVGVYAFGNFGDDSAIAPYASDTADTTNAITTINATTATMETNQPSVQTTIDQPTHADTMPPDVTIAPEQTKKPKATTKPPVATATPPAYCKTCGTCAVCVFRIKSDWSRNDDNYVFEDVVIDHYHGSYNGSVAMMIRWKDSGYTMAFWTETVAGIGITYRDGRRIWVWNNGDFHTLSEAYDLGLLTKSNIKDIQSKHNYN